MPVAGRSLGAEAVAGTVVVRLPGADAPVALSQASALPVGSAVDACSGTVALASAASKGEPQRAEFSGAVFSIGQKRAKRPLTVLTLKGGDVGACRAAASGLARASAGAKKVRSLWGSGHGRFTTRGRNSAATVRGTIWLTEDRCDGTLTRVRRGTVTVRDQARGRSVTVRAGQGHLAKTP